MFVAILVTAVVTVVGFVHIAGRMSARRPGLGSMSESWLAEERASETSRA